MTFLDISKPGFPGLPFIFELIQAVDTMVANTAPLAEKPNAEDAAAAALFLVSDAAAPITGAVQDVWGGTRVTIRG